MRADYPATPLAWRRYLLLGLAAGMLAAATACGDAATPVATNLPVEPSAETMENTVTVMTPTPVANTATGTAPTLIPTPAATETPVAGPIVRVDGTDIPVELAVTSEERVKGLSGRASLDAGTGMLFIFEIETQLRFWMREMEISLDMVWINSDCRVVDISVNVPPPEPGMSLDDLPRYSPSAPARYVLELNGGEAESLGVEVGERMEFLGEILGKSTDGYGC